VGALMGEMKRAIAREERARAMEDQKHVTDRFTSTLVIAASIIAAVRLARDQDISRPSPRLTSVIWRKFFIVTLKCGRNIKLLLIL
jgi:hypothetical protein